MREYLPIKSLGFDRYKITTIKTDKEGTKREDTYIVDLKINYCQCRAWFFSSFPKWCPHIKEVVAQLRAGGHCIVWNKQEKCHYDLGLKTKRLLG